MKTFRFRLEQVLRWRRTELDLEEGRLKQLHAAVAALDRQRAELESARDDACRSLLSRAAVYGVDLQLLASYRDAVKLQTARLEQKRTAREAEIASQKEKLLESRRRFRLLEKLRERKLADWQYESERQAEADLPAPRRPSVVSARPKEGSPLVRFDDENTVTNKVKEIRMQSDPNPW